MGHWNYGKSDIIFLRMITFWYKSNFVYFGMEGWVTAFSVHITRLKIQKFNFILKPGVLQCFLMFSRVPIINCSFITSSNSSYLHSTYIWGFRAYQHERSLAPVVNDFLRLWWPNDIWGWIGPKFSPTFVLQLRKNSRKNLNQEKLTWGSNPGPLGERQQSYQTTKSGASSLFVRFVSI